jgi:hypothetical protein
MMAASTTPIVLAGGATVIADYIEHKGIQWRVLVATGLAAGAFALIEKADPPLVVGIAWIAFIGSMIAPRPNGQLPPAEVFLNQWNATK